MAQSKFPIAPEESGMSLARVESETRWNPRTRMQTRTRKQINKIDQDRTNNV